MGVRAAAAAIAVVLAAAAARADTLVVPSEDFPTIQSAVDAAVAGDLVLVGPGNWAETVTVTGKTDLEIRGRGFPVVNRTGVGEPCFDVYGANTGLLIQGFEVAGGTYGVVVNDATDVRLVKLRIRDCTQAGISLEEGTGILVSRCEVTGSGGHGIEDFGSENLVIEKCRVSGSVDDGLSLSVAEGGALGSNFAVVTKNRVEGGYGGIRFAGEEAELSKNRVEGWTDIGIEVMTGTSSIGTDLVGNRVSGGGGAVGIKVNVPSTTVSKNVLDGSAIYFDGNNQFCDRNRVADAVWGVYSSGNNCTITGNRLSDLGAFGLRCNGSQCVVDGNAIAGSGGNGLEINGPDNTFSGNKVSGVTGNGIDVTTTGNEFLGNKAKGSGGVDLRDHNVEGLNLYEGNRFGTVEFEPAP